MADEKGLTLEDVTEGKRKLVPVWQELDAEGNPKQIAAPCLHCGKQWSLGPDDPVAGFHFKVPKGEGILSLGHDGQMPHPFLRFRIVSCPACRRSVTEMAQNELGATEIGFSGGRIALLGTPRRVPLPFVEDGPKD